MKRTLWALAALLLWVLWLLEHPAPRQESERTRMQSPQVSIQFSPFSLSASRVPPALAVPYRMPAASQVETHLLELLQFQKDSSDLRLVPIKN
jgi:hypothetical protein